MTRESIDDDFAEYHQANPDVYAELVRLARQAKDLGRHTVGIKHLVEVVRWNRMMSRGGKQFKIDNRFTSRYARLIQSKEPELDGMFVTRKLTSAEAAS